MRTKRPLMVNTSLCHGICNFNCRLCGVNKSSYKGPKEYQEEAVTRAILEKTLSAAKRGVRIRRIAFSGDGEPTMHPEFAQRIAILKEWHDNWDADSERPELSIVTNGSNLHKDEIMAALTSAPITVNLSFPTCDPEAYGTIMLGKAEAGQAMLDRVIPGIQRLMENVATGKASCLNFHISPPERDIIRRDFHKTVDCLTQMAEKAGMARITLVMFPVTSNRAGLIRNRVKGLDSYKDFFREFNGKKRNGVTIDMTTVVKKIYTSFGEFLDLVRAYNSPCMWNGQIFLAADGTSVCSNDQSLRTPLGNILDHEIEELMSRKERLLPTITCKGCDNIPSKLSGTPMAAFLNITGRAKMAWAKWTGNYEPKE